MRDKPAICIVFMDDYPWDVRVEKFVHSLAKAGYAVHVVCRNISRRPRCERTRDAIIHRLPCFKNRRVNYAVNFPAFFNPLWVSRVHGVVSRYNVRLLIVRDVPLALTAALVARVSKIPLLIDVAENYPALTWQLWVYGKPRITDLLVRNPILVKLTERLALRLADHVLVVVDESRDRLIREGVRPGKISVVMNVPPVPTLKCFTRGTEVVGLQNNNKYVMMYVGNMDPSRGIDFLLRSIRAVLRRIPSFQLVVCGSHRTDRQLRSLANRLRLGQSVLFTGWLPHKEMLSLLNLADVCIIPHRPTAHTNTTIPNKLFDYMAAGKPVVSSNLAPVRRIIGKERCGLVLRRLTPGELLNCLTQLCDPETSRRLGERGREAVLREYNWGAAEKKLVQIVTSLMQA